MISPYDGEPTSNGLSALPAERQIAFLGNLSGDMLRQVGYEDIIISDLGYTGIRLTSIARLVSELGADAYLWFDPDKSTTQARAYADGRLLINPSSVEVTIDGEHIDIPQRAFRLLDFMSAYRREVFSRSQLLKNVWDDKDHPDESTVTQHIKVVRRSLGALGWTIHTVRNMGYKFDDRTESMPQEITGS